MRFYLHEPFHPDTVAALKKQEQAAQTTADLEGKPASTAELMQVLAKKQWNLLTNDPELVQTIYDQKIEFNGVVVLLLPEDGQPAEPAAALARLFERYKRLTARRLYTVTPSRVKIRQLPGAGMV